MSYLRGISEASLIFFLLIILFTPIVNYLYPPVSLWINSCGVTFQMNLFSRFNTVLLSRIKGLPALLKWGLEFVTALTIAEKQTIRTAIHIHGQKPSVNKWLWQVDWTHFLEVSYFVTVVASNFVTYRNVLVLFSLNI